MGYLKTALNSQEDNHDILAINFELAPSGNLPPSEIMLIPPGASVTGRDGRAWNNANPQGIVDWFHARNLKIPFDIEHATELKAPKGEAAPAMAWGINLEAKPDGSIWSSVEWTPRGAEMIMNREYSYYSPAIIFDKTTMNIVGIKSVGLTNTPNFHIPALNRQTQQEETMTLTALLAALALSPTATFDDALNSIAGLKSNLATALNQAQNPSLDKFVPKADYDLAVNRANDAEGKLTAQAKETLEAAINSEIDAALQAGKITPATKEYHVAQCRQEGGLDRFREFVKAAPAVGESSGLDKKKPGEEGAALNAEEAKIAAMFGNSVEDIGKYGKAA